ncbi:PqiC family protein [Cognatiyoonia sp.]|uniref:PqiC family protein n=1 Tax=Cognatiyoonia sp. TaxID=2211652 RepID=UPI003F699F87
MIRILLALSIATLTACSTTPTNRLDFSPVTSELKLHALVRSAMVRTVSLPTYAAAEEIAIELAPGIIGTSADILWADDPERAVTLAMTQQLDAILSATVGPDPWPFAGLPDVAIDVRVAQMLAGSDGLFHLSGQYFIGGDGIDFPNGSFGFDIRKPLNSGEVRDIARAQALALLELSEGIAKRLAR